MAYVFGRQGRVTAADEQLIRESGRALFESAQRDFEGDIERAREDRNRRIAEALAKGSGAAGLFRKNRDADERP